MSIETQARASVAAMIESNHLRALFPKDSLAETYMICASIRGVGAGVAASTDIIKGKLCENQTTEQTMTTQANGGTSLT